VVDKRKTPLSPTSNANARKFLKQKRAANSSPSIENGVSLGGL